MAGKESSRGGNGVSAPPLAEGLYMKWEEDEEVKGRRELIRAGFSGRDAGFEFALALPADSAEYPG